MVERGDVEGVVLARENPGDMLRDALAEGATGLASVVGTMLTLDLDRPEVDPALLGDRVGEKAPIARPLDRRERPLEVHGDD